MNPGELALDESKYTSPTVTTFITTTFLPLIKGKISHLLKYICLHCLSDIQMPSKLTCQDFYFSKKLAFHRQTKKPHTQTTTDHV